MIHFLLKKNNRVVFDNIKYCKYKIIKQIINIMKIKDSVILITGGSSGIGKAAAKLLADSGCLLYTSDAADE